MDKSIIHSSRTLITAAMTKLLLALMGCAALSQGGREPERGRDIDMVKYGKLFDIKIGDRFRTKVDYVYSDIPSFDRTIRDARVGGISKGEVLVKPGMEVTLERIEAGPFGPIAWVTISKPFAENRPTPLISLFGGISGDGRRLLDVECYDRIK